MVRKHILLAVFLVCNCAIGADLTVHNATVTRVQTYEREDDKAQAWIFLNGNSRVGPNPVNSTETCELWTYDKSVYSAALAALMSGRKVDVTYVDRGEGTYWCKVRHFSIVAN